jgi:ferredoxin
MRIHIDPDLCQVHGVCESEAPDVFVVEKGADIVTVLDPAPGEDQREAVLAAVEYCPTRAIIIDDEGGA